MSDPINLISERLTERGGTRWSSLPAATGHRLGSSGAKSIQGHIESSYCIATEHLHRILRVHFVFVE